MKIEKLKIAHIAEFATQKTFRDLAKYAPPSSWHLLEKDPNTQAAVTDDGQVVAIGGLTPYWENRAEVWVLIHAEVKRSFVALHGHAKNFLSAAPFKRIEAAVECDSKFSHRWVKALGFELEAPRLKSYLPGGQDCALYARVS